MLNKSSRKVPNVLLKGGRLFDPGIGLDSRKDLLIVDGKIKQIGSANDIPENTEVVDCTGWTIAPGLVDMHVHLREPGQEDKETIETGTQAAMAGGFTAVCAMPNTKPPVDDRSYVEFIKKRSKDLLVEVYPIGAITKGLEGKELTEMGDMLEAGAVAFSDDGMPVENTRIFRKALEYCKMFNCPIIEHSEDRSLAEGGAMNEGLVATQLGIRGIPSLSEAVAVSRDCCVAEYTESKLHIAHVSTKEAVSIIRRAKAHGVNVTAETCPHYFVLTDEAVRGYDTNTKMNPPLRTEEDRLAILEGLKDGTLDVIATDHAPHKVDDKDEDYQQAAFGIVGLETVVGLVLTFLVHKGQITLDQVIRQMSINPRHILNLPPNEIKEGHVANLTFLNPDMEWTVDKAAFLSKGRNTPFHGMKLKGASAGVYSQGQLFLNGSV